MPVTTATTASEPTPATRTVEAVVGERARAVAVAALAVALLTAGLGAYTLWDPDEGRHSSVAREVFAAPTWHGWIVPSRNFAAYHDKPILYYWLTSLAYGVVGVNEVGARLVSVLAALVTLGALFAWTRRVLDVATATRAVLVLATSMGFACLGRYGSLDMTLTCWLTVGLLAAERWTADPDRRVFLVVAAAAGGLGMLTKGLVAPLFIGGVPLLHALLVRRRLLVRPADVAVVFAVFVGVAAPWYVAAGVVDPAYLREFFVVHHLERFTSEGTKFHAGAWWYYAPALVLMMFPWSFFLPASVGAAAPRRDPAIAYVLCWAAVVLVFFSLSHGKLATYILPVLPPLAVVVAYGLRTLEASPASRPALARVAGGGIVALAVALAAIAAVALRAHHPPWDDVVRAHRVAIVLLPIGGAIGVGAWWRRGLGPACVVVATTTAGALLYFYVVAAPAVSRVTSEGAFAHAVVAHPDAPIVSYQVTPASLMFYVRRPILRINRPRELRDAVANAPFVWIVTSQRHVAEIALITPAFPWVTGGRHVLYATAPPPGAPARDAARADDQPGH